MVRFYVIILVVLVIISSCRKNDVDCNFVDNTPDLTMVRMDEDATACFFEGKSIQMDAPLYKSTSFLWSPGGDTSSSITVLAPGVYSVTVFRFSDTITYEKEVAACDGFYAPNVISPNWDGDNDELDFIGSGIGCFNVEIRDSEGNLVFESNDIDNSWEGALNNKGHTLPLGVYTYHVEYVKQEGAENTVVTGRVVLIK